MPVTDYSGTAKAQRDISFYLMDYSWRRPHLFNKVCRRGSPCYKAPYSLTAADVEPTSFLSTNTTKYTSPNIGIKDKTTPSKPARTGV